MNLETSNIPRIKSNDERHIVNVYDNLEKIRHTHLFSKLVEKYSEANEIPQDEITEMVLYMINAQLKGVSLDLPEQAVFNRVRELFVEWSEENPEKIDKA